MSTLKVLRSLVFVLDSVQYHEDKKLFFVNGPANANVENEDKVCPKLKLLFHQLQKLADPSVSLSCGKFHFEIIYICTLFRATIIFKAISI